MSGHALRSLLRSAVGFTLYALAAPADATVVQRATLEELVGESAVIVHGIVRHVDETAGAARGRFRTAIDLGIQEPLKGLAASTRTFRLEVPGGRVGELSMHIPGMPRFSHGDEVVLLLERGPRGYALSGLTQGVFHVERASGIARVSRPGAAAALVDAQGRAASPAPVPKTLPELLTRVRRLVGTEAPP